MKPEHANNLALSPFLTAIPSKRKENKPLRNPLCLQRNAVSLCRDLETILSRPLTFNLHLFIWSKNNSCESKTQRKNCHSNTTTNNNEDRGLFKPRTNVDYPLKLTLEEWEHFVILMFIVNFLYSAFWMLFIRGKNASLSCLGISPRVQLYVII